MRDNLDRDDQFTPYEDKSYDPARFFTSSGEFNLSQFNKLYREEQLKRINFYRSQEEARLKELDKNQPAPDLLNYTLGQHLINMKNTPFNIGSDLINDQFSYRIFTKDNRMFYLGLILVIIFLIYLILAYFLNSN